jgi:hypothetical protein
VGNPRLPDYALLRITTGQQTLSLHISAQTVRLTRVCDGGLQLYPIGGNFVKLIDFYAV